MMVITATPAMMVTDAAPVIVANACSNAEWACCSRWAPRGPGSVLAIAIASPSVCRGLMAAPGDTPSAAPIIAWR
jgi:hypothetical protein